LINNQPQSIILVNDVKSYLLDQELLIFSIHQQRLFRFNTVAAFIWCCLEEKLPTPKVIDELVKSFGITESQAKHDFDLIVRQWDSAGLIQSEFDKPEIHYPTNPKIKASLNYDYSKNQQFATTSPRYYQLLDSCFQMTFSNETQINIVHPLLKHLEVLKPLDSMTELKITKNDSEYVLFANKEAIDFCIDEQTVTPMMHANILALAYEKVDCLLAIHAGAVSKGDQCILLPAVSGSGKSTLTAALLNEGYNYCTDDLVILSKDTLRIRSVPVSLGIKAGSWPILATLFPIIDELPTFTRMDNKQVRYLPPPANALNNDHKKSYAVKHIVFPSYNANVPMNISPVSTSDSLCRLTEAGYDVGGHLEISHVDNLVEWVSGMTCYTLEYNNLSDAISEIKKLL